MSERTIEIADDSKGYRVALTAEARSRVLAMVGELLDGIDRELIDLRSKHPTEGQTA